MRHIDTQKYLSLRQICDTPIGCKIRENSFGVCWCVRCGRLFKNMNSPILDENDKLRVVI